MTKIKISDLEKRVKNGIKFLNSVDKKWFKKIKLETFDIEDATQCVCGQVFGDYWNVIVKSLKGKNKKEMTEAQAISRGFSVGATVSTTTRQVRFDFLQKLWVIEILKAKGF